MYLYLFGGTHLQVRQTCRQIFALDGSNDADSRKNMPFGGLVDIAPDLGVKLSKTPNFGGMNTRFQFKRTNY